MKKTLFIILLIISLFTLSCKDKITSPLNNPIGITVNPNGTTPLSAVYTRETVNTAPITVTVKGLYGEPDIIHTYPAGYGREFEIHGMFAESMNTIEVNDGGRIITKNVYVGALQNGIQKKYDVSINNLPEEKYPNNPNLYFSVMNSSSSVSATLGISRSGFLRYFQIYNQTKIVIENKRMVLYPTIDTRNPDTQKNVDLLGNTLIKYPTIPHHDSIKVNNNYIYLSYSDWGSQDRLVEINSSGTKLKELNFGKLIQASLDLKTYPGDEAIFKQIAFSEDLDNIYNNNGQQQVIDWFHANSLVYDSSTDILYVSSRHRGVLAIDYSEFRLIWWMADETLATEVPLYIPYNIHLKDLKSLDAYSVKGDGMNDGPKNQHALFLLANGNLGMFDNQGDENTNPNGSRYVEYSIT
ncbi:aryl-sulfate sulfotransferase, partial [Brachyspira hampsonii]|uniref:aryl-sulfate sulfotransferase n=1 Tax=Brachyspira hampsonii TaxID=1287055 RepID=UPI001C678690